MKKVFVLEKERNKDSASTLPVFIKAEQHAIIKELSMETNIPIKRIVEKMINYALDDLEVFMDED